MSAWQEAWAGRGAAAKGAVPKSWQALVKKKRGFSNHFVALAESRRTTLVHLAAALDSVTIEGEQLCFTFQSKSHRPVRLTAALPFGGKFKADVPKSHRVVCALHNGLRFTSPGSKRLGLALSGVVGGVLDGAEVVEALEERDSAWLATMKKKGMGVQSPLFTEQDWYVFDPTRRGKGREPSVRFVSHEGGEPEAASPEDALGFEIFLDALAKAVLA